MNLKNIRESKNMTQAELAIELNVSRTSVAMWETGGALPRTSTLMRAAEVLGCTVDELLRGEEENNEKAPSGEGA